MKTTGRKQRYPEPKHIPIKRTIGRKRIFGGKTYSLGAIAGNKSSAMSHARMFKRAGRSFVRIIKYSNDMYYVYVRD